MSTNNPTIVMTLMCLVMAATLGMVACLTILATQAKALLDQAKTLTGEAKPKINGVQSHANLLKTRFVSLAAVLQDARQRLTPKLMDMKGEAEHTLELAQDAAHKVGSIAHEARGDLKVARLVSGV